MGGFGGPNNQLASRIDNDFTYHRPPPDAQGHFVALRETAKDLAHLINDVDLDPRTH
jgi:hypothetical protein